MTKTILIVDDEPSVIDSLTMNMELEGWIVVGRKSGSAITDEDIRSSNLAIVDLALGKDNEPGDQVARQIKRRSNNRIPVIILTGNNIEPAAADRMADGDVERYLKKMHDLDDLLNHCKEWLLIEESRANVEQHRTRPIDTVGGRPASILDPRVRRTIADIDTHIARSLMPVLIVGESGTGKEDIAREIHQKSGLPDSNFRAINCAAVAESLLMSELFGHTKGAFTGAAEHRLGLILEAAGITGTKGSQAQRSARAEVRETLEVLWKLSKMDKAKLVESMWKKHTSGVESFYDRVVSFGKKITDIKGSVAPSAAYLDWLREFAEVEVDAASMTFIFKALGQHTQGASGTLFLDEVADLPEEAQAALLRFLDGHGIRPVGYSDLPLSPKLRVIAATNKTSVLFGTDSQSSFRSDLLWRLAGWIIELPSLIDRPDDAENAAVLRAKNKDRQRYDGRSFSLSGQAAILLKRMVADGDFSGDTPLKSGNFRNLNWLIDRACWTTATKDPAAKEIGVDAIKEASIQILELQRRHLTPHSETQQFAARNTTTKSEPGLKQMAAALNLPTELCIDDLPPRTATVVQVLYARLNGEKAKTADRTFPGSARKEEKFRLYVVARWIAKEESLCQKFYGSNCQGVRSQVSRFKPSGFDLQAPKGASSTDRDKVEQAIIARLLETLPDDPSMDGGSRD